MILFCKLIAPLCVLLVGILWDPCILLWFWCWYKCWFDNLPPKGTGATYSSRKGRALNIKRERGRGGGSSYTLQLRNCRKIWLCIALTAAIKVTLLVHMYLLNAENGIQTCGIQASPHQDLHRRRDRRDKQKSTNKS